MMADVKIVEVPSSLYGAQGVLTVAEIAIPADKPVSVTGLAKGPTSQRVLVMGPDLFSSVLLDWQGQNTEIGNVTAAIPFLRIYVFSAHKARPEENQAITWHANPMSVAGSAETSVIVSGLDSEGGVDVTIAW